MIVYSFISVLGKFFSNFLFLVLASQFLIVEEYQELSYIFVVVGIVSIFIDYGYNFLIVRYQSEKKYFFSNFILLKIVLTFASFLIGSFYFNLESTYSIDSFLFFMVGGGLYSYQVLFLAIIRVEFGFKKEAQYSSISTLLFILISVFGVFNAASLYELGLCFLAARTLSFISILPFSIKILSQSELPSVTGALSVAKRGYSYAIFVIGGYMFINLDGLMAYTYFGPHYSAVIVALGKIVLLAQLPLESISNVWFQKVCKVNKYDSLYIKNRNFFVFLLFSVSTLALVVAGQDLFEILFPPLSQEMVPSISILISVIMIRMFGLHISTAINYFHLQVYRNIAMLISIVFMISCFYIMPANSSVKSIYSIVLLTLLLNNIQYMLIVGCKVGWSVLDFRVFLSLIFYLSFINLI